MDVARATAKRDKIASIRNPGDAGQYKMRPSDIADLRSLAANDAPDARRALFDKIADLLCVNSTTLSEHEQLLMDDILLGLIDQVEMTIRANLSERLADRPDVPPKLLDFLARDDISVALPIIQRCETLRDETLVAAAIEGSHDHRDGIARRPQISPAVCETLAEYGETDVVLVMLDNPGAELSRGATDRLVSRAEQENDLHRPLLKRSELETDQAHNLFWSVSAALRSFILKRFEIDESLLDEALSDSTAKAAEKLKADQRFSSAFRKVSAHRHEVIADFVAGLRSKKGVVLTKAFASLLGIEENTAARVLADPGGEPLAICCKALGADRQQFTRIFLLVDYQRFGRARPTGHLMQVSAAYDLISAEAAQRTVHFWDRQSSVTAA